MRPASQGPTDSRLAFLAWLVKSKTQKLCSSLRLSALSHSQPCFIHALESKTSRGLEGGRRRGRLRPGTQCALSLSPTAPELPPTCATVPALDTLAGMPTSCPPTANDLDQRCFRITMERNRALIHRSNNDVCIGSQKSVHFRVGCCRIRQPADMRPVPRASAPGRDSPTRRPCQRPLDPLEPSSTQTLNYPKAHSAASASYHPSQRWPVWSLRCHVSWLAHRKRKNFLSACMYKIVSRR